MLTVLDAINLSADYLIKKGIDSPKLNAELLLAHTLNCKRFDLYLRFDRPLTIDETNNYRSLLKRRASFEPLQYIIGSVEFYGLNFNVNPSVLIPRQETEILVESIIKTFMPEDEISILDIGTGSGIIAVCLAKHFINSKITAIDISDDALLTAKINAELNEVNGRIDFVKADITNQFKNSFKFDLVVSNPPYVSVKDYAGLKPELKVYEPREALTDNSDGLQFYKVITSACKEYLKLNGKLFFELGQGQHDEVKNILDRNNFVSIEIIKDYSGIERVITGELNC